MKGLITYLNFDGNCREAMKFYERSLGGQLHMVPFSEAPGNFPQEAKDRIMHASLTIGSAAIMASDTMPGTPFKQGNNFSLCINSESLEETEKLFNILGENGKVTMPLQDTFWGARFGMLTDQFGINWMFNFEKPKQ
jgi:PhnB protein